MNPTTPNEKSKSNHFHNRKPTQTQVLAKTQPNTTGSVKNSDHSSVNTNRGSRGSYQYSKNKSGRRPKTQAQSANNTTTSSQKRKTHLIPPVAPGVIRIIPLGGVEEIGKNMTAIEIGNDIIVISSRTLLIISFSINNA